MLDRNNLEYLKILKAIILGGEALTADLYSDIIQYTDAEIYNIYGPAETTVWSTNAHITSTDITIGKPIANTQIYILDNNRQPLPIGVAGELCISGDGVGKGYLNLPELTAEKFIPNPFINGKTMYCTGDLALWRNDGSIEYLGRIDTQVKIRGLRIELGEIESAMNGFKGIHMTAVTDKCDEKGHQYLVGYYTSEIYIDERQLRQHLAAKLPKYMIPNYFMRLQDIPMTASGKTDRKNLPIPQFSLNEAAEYIEPKTEMEIKLCNLLSELLEVEKVGVSEDFFDMGGDSLTAIEYVVKAHSVGIEIKPQNVFEYPTVQDLCEYLENGTTKNSVIYKHENFEKYDNLLKQNMLTDNFTPQKKTIGDVLLTGSTGFLGAHILDALMQNETGKIYCLVRGSKEKLIETLHYYFGNKYDNEVDSRIITVIGDITLPYLSDNVPKNIQTVFHAAATVKHYGQYDYFYKVNVKGTRNVINYAKQVNAKLIHISTISVSGNSFADAFTIYRSENEKHFDEQSLYIDQSLENVYIRSKFEGELSVLDAMLAGIDAKIIRVGNLTNRTGDYKFQPNYKENAFLTRVKAALEFGKLPDYIMPLYAEFSPVNETAEGVIRIAQYADRQNIFHLNSNKPIYFTDLIEALKKLRIPIETVSGNEFSDILKNYANEPKTEYIYKAFQNDMDDNGKLVYDSNIRIINKFTVQFLRKIGFEWTQIDFEYIKGYVEYFRNLGYLEVEL